MGKRLDIINSGGSYPVEIEHGLRFRTEEKIRQVCPDATSVFLIADENAASHYLNDVLSSFQQPPHVIFLQPGEGSKSIEELQRVLTELLEHGADRKSVVAALGGGVTGDLAGFAAAVLLRGVSFVQIPTTLLAHDSSVGGKTGINHPSGKNLIGAFYAPAAVLYDPAMLQTLPEGEWRSGFAEVIKHSLISRSGFLEWLSDNVNNPRDLQDEALEELLYRSIQVKASIVEEDEFEAGVRAYLNFGHTLGHAIEAEAGYGTWTHGEAVALGMLAAMHLSRFKLQADLPLENVKELLENHGFQTALPHSFDHQKLLERMKRDKKTEAGNLRFVLLRELGMPELIPVETELVKEALKEVTSDD
ncbi:3-dehydroquinate synthase [Alkalicoccus luteus]|uniref:3-dehydroquinate synthase n=1 Tax=Alkalicoccus luteus TaxID=1237094 RepID=A0A969PTP0_9BACI|nr:3-dehydroquinate synthase [Alkalicoccus luteus]NJP38191.1 3-dehydroquinate synthase [Alkalicoccus luteus]